MTLKLGESKPAGNRTKVSRPGHEKALAKFYILLFRYEINQFSKKVYLTQ